MNTLAVGALVAGLLIAIPAIFCAVVLLMSRLSGWHALAATYAARQPPHGARFSGQSAGFGAISYRNALTIFVATEGLFLTAPIFLKIGHPPLFLPWAAIRNEKAEKFLWQESVAFEVGAPPLARLRLAKAIYDARGAADTAS